jgi:hypothetical protein
MKKIKFFDFTKQSLKPGFTTHPYIHTSIPPSAHPPKPEELLATNNFQPKIFETILKTSFFLLLLYFY